MGLLDEAIREHLELKRRRGADAGEISREESEALGPVRRGPDGTPDLSAIAAAQHAYEEPVAAEDAPGDAGWEEQTAIHVPEPEPPAAHAPPPPAYEPAPPPPAAYEPPAPPRPAAYEPPAPPRPAAYEPPAPPPRPAAYEPPPVAYPPPATPKPTAYEPPAPPRPAYEPPPAPPHPAHEPPPPPPSLRRERQAPPPFEPLLPSSASPPPPPPPPPPPVEPAYEPPARDVDPPAPETPDSGPREKSRFSAASRPLRLRRRVKGDADGPAAPPPPGRFGAHDRQTPAHEPVQEPFYDAPRQGAPPPPPPPPYAPPPAAVEPAGEDLLEETPEFLEETPDHDRLWFEQRPPRDFDFDG